MVKHLRRLLFGSMLMLTTLVITAIIVGLVFLAVMHPWTGFISGGLFFLGFAYILGTIHD